MAGNSTLSMNEIRDSGVCIVALTGRVDSTNADDVRQRLTSLLAAEEKSIVVDLAGVPYLTSLGFRALLIFAREAERKATSVALCGMNGHVRDLFEMAGLLAMFTVHASRQDAIAKATAGE